MPHPGRRRITADHFIVGQFVDVTGDDPRSARASPADEALELRRSRASHGVSVSHRSHGSTGGRQDPGKTFKNKEMAGHLGAERVTTQNLRVVPADTIERGLILVEGSVPAIAAWIFVRDAVKRAAEDALPEARSKMLRQRPETRRGCRCKTKKPEDRRLSLDGPNRPVRSGSTTIFGLEPRMDLIHRVIQWQLAKRQRRHP